MGLLESILGRSKKSKRKEVSQKKVQSGDALIIEEVKPTSSAPKTTKIAETKGVSAPVNEGDEVKKFIEVTEKLRKEAGLPPALVQQKPAQAVAKPPASPSPQPAPPTPAPTTPQNPSSPKPVLVTSSVQGATTSTTEKTSTPVLSPSPPLKTDETSTRSPPRKGPATAKIIKVSTNRLLSALEKMLEEDLRKQGVKGFKEIALKKRKLKEFIVEKANYISDKFVEALKSGVDPRDPSFINPLAKELYAEFTEKNLIIESEKKEEQEKGEEDDLLSLLEGGDQAKEQEENEEDLFKMLQDI